MVEVVGVKVHGLLISLIMHVLLLLFLLWPRPQHEVIAVASVPMHVVAVTMPKAVVKPTSHHQNKRAASRKTKKPPAVSRHAKRSAIAKTYHRQQTPKPSGSKVKKSSVKKTANTVVKKPAHAPSASKKMEDPVAKPKKSPMDDRWLQNELAAESTTPATRPNNLQLAGLQHRLIDAIARQWQVPKGVEEGESCLLTLRLAPDGVVISVAITEPSGNPSLDRSAREAVLRASPLPVPQQAQLFASFRLFSIRVKPEGMLASS